jgi:hypothetical protein
MTRRAGIGKAIGIYEKSTDQEQNCPEIQTQSWRDPASTGEVPAKEGEAILLQRERIHKRGPAPDRAVQFCPCMIFRTTLISI